jgi:hypothetical protein
MSSRNSINSKDWIPVSTGMTIGQELDSRFHGNDEEAKTLIKSLERKALESLNP